jgi:DNA methyltransferase 1-associated protein 1
MPTVTNVAKLDELVEATTLLLDIKKAVDRVDYEIGVAKGQLGIDDDRDNGNNEEAMDVDEDADERAQSVASARSGRGRKQVGVKNFTHFFQF